MGYFQKQAAERHRGVDAARRWAESNGHDSRDGFPEWCWDTGREGDYAAAHETWMSSPARIERWAERHGIFVGKAFAGWYIAEGRSDAFADAYREYRALRAAELFNSRCPEGTPVRYWTGAREGSGQTGRTRSAASVLGGHTAVVWVTGHGACIALTHVVPTLESEG